MALADLEATLRREGWGIDLAKWQAEQNARTAGAGQEGSHIGFWSRFGKGAAAVGGVVAAPYTGGASLAVTSKAIQSLANERNKQSILNTAGQIAGAAAPTAEALAAGRAAGRMDEATMNQRQDTLAEARYRDQIAATQGQNVSQPEHGELRVEQGRDGSRAAQLHACRTGEASLQLGARRHSRERARCRDFGSAERRERPDDYRRAPSIDVLGQHAGVGRADVHAGVGAATSGRPVRAVAGHAGLHRAAECTGADAVAAGEHAGQDPDDHRHDWLARLHDSRLRRDSGEATSGSRRRWMRAERILIIGRHTDAGDG